MEIKNKQISILGCGWLGFPLAKQFISEGFLVKGSTTSIEKLKLFESEKIKPYSIDLTEEKIKGNIVDFLTNTEVLIIAIPPKLRGENNENFVQKIENLIPFIEESKVKKVLFVSSTSVYDDQSNQFEINEETIPNPRTESGKQLLQTEQILQSNTNFSTTILRFGGLIGEKRHPVNHLAGKENIENPDVPINLIHQKDCIEIISKIVCHTEPVEVFGEIFNAVASFHPTRKDYYTKKAKEMNLITPQFVIENKENGKIISSQKIITRLNHNFNLDLY